MKQFASQPKGNKKGMRAAATALDRRSNTTTVGKSVANNLHVQQTIGNQVVQGMIKPGTSQIIDNRSQPRIIHNREEDNQQQRVKKAFSNPLSQQKATIPDKQTGEIAPENSSYQLTMMSDELPSMSNVETRTQIPQIIQCQAEEEEEKQSLKPPPIPIEENLTVKAYLRFLSKERDIEGKPESKEKALAATDYIIRDTSSLISFFLDEELYYLLILELMHGNVVTKKHRNGILEILQRMGVISS